ncbi:MAG: hypothetical protein ACHQUC_01590 [Chlamydiales bacterium]
MINLIARGTYERSFFVNAEFIIHEMFLVGATTNYHTHPRIKVFAKKR